MNKTFLILFFFLITSLFSYGQDSNIFSELASYKHSSGKIIIFQDAKIRMLLNDYVKSKEKEKGINGYRIQIFFGSGHSARENANNIRNSFVSLHKDIPAHVVFEDPNFKVRVGDFRNKSDALKILIEVEAEYKGSYIVKDFIDFPDLD